MISARSRSGPALLAVLIALLSASVPQAARADTPVPAPAPPEVTADGAVLWEPASDTVLFDRAANVGRPMASTTKIMTVLLAIEAGAVEDEIVVSSRAAQIGAVPGGASLGLVQGQQVPMASLLAGLMLRSGNDAAVAVADHLAGDEAAFTDVMNERAAAMGLGETNFVNSSGLTNDPDHRASPMDLARLADVAMQDALFAELAGAQEREIEGFGLLSNRNELLAELDYATGIKTGFTSLAGLCLVASGQRDGRTLYAVVLGSDDSFADAQALLEHGFDDFELVARDRGDPVGVHRWADAQVDLVLDAPLSATVPAGAEVSQLVQARTGLARPASAGSPAGALALRAGGEELVARDLVLASSVEARQPGSPDNEAGALLQDAIWDMTRVVPFDGDA